MRDRILNSVREHILKYGFRKFTVDDICTDLKTSKKTIYKYFNSKDDIISEIVDAHIEADKANTIKAIESGSNLYDKLSSAILCYYQYSIPLKLVYELEQFYPKQWSKVTELFQFKQKLLEALIEEGMKEGSINNEVNIDVIMLIFQKTIPAIIDYEFLVSHDRKRMTVNHMLEELCKIIFYGILKK